MNKATEIILVTAFAFILASFQLSNGKYLLVEVEKQKEFDSSSPVAQLHARQGHDQCWQCVHFFCIHKEQADTIINFRSECKQFRNEDNFPSKKWLVNCANTVCTKAAFGIQEFCVEGFVSTNPDINRLRKSCHEE